MASIRAMFFCDDVRQELGNKLTAVGLYGEFIGFPPGEGQIILPKLAAVFIVAGLRGAATIGMRQRISVHAKGSASGQLTGSPVQMTRDAETDEQNIVLQTSPVVFPGDCEITASVELTINGVAERFENSIAVKRLKPGVLPVLPPGADMN